MSFGVLENWRWCLIIKRENFYKVIKRAMIVCENSRRAVADDFPEIRKIVNAGATAKPVMLDE